MTAPELHEMLTTVFRPIMQYVVGFYVAKTIGHYILFLGRVAQNVTSLILSQFLLSKSSQEEDDRDGRY